MASWHDVMGNKEQADQMRALDHLEAWGYCGGYSTVFTASKKLVERGLVEKCWDWPDNHDYFQLTLEGCRELRVMLARYGLPERKVRPMRPFHGTLDGVCGLSGEENRMLLYLGHKKHLWHSPNAYEIHHALCHKRLIEPLLGWWWRTLEGKIVLRHVLKALHWKEEDIPSVKAKGK